MKYLKFVLIICLIVFANDGTVQAQKYNKIPSSQAEIQKMATQRPVNRMTTLPASEKIKLVQLAFAGKGDQGKTKNYSLVLPQTFDIRNTYNEGKTRISFASAISVSAFDNEVVFDHNNQSQQPHIRIDFVTETPGYYIFDFAVANSGDDAKVEFWRPLEEPQSKTFQYKKGVQHLIFVAEIKYPGWEPILLQSTGGSWKFYSVEISQYK